MLYMLILRDTHSNLYQPVQCTLYIDIDPTRFMQQNKVQTEL